MPTDDELAKLLRRSFDRATADLEPKRDLVHAVRRRYVSTRRRRLAIGVAVPAAALAAGTGVAMTGQSNSNHHPGHTAVAVPRPSAPTTSVATPTKTHVPLSVKYQRPAGFSDLPMGDVAFAGHCGGALWRPLPTTL